MKTATNDSNVSKTVGNNIETIRNIEIIENVICDYFKLNSELLNCQDYKFKGVISKRFFYIHKRDREYVTFRFIGWPLMLNLIGVNPEYLAKRYGFTRASIYHALKASNNDFRFNVWYRKIVQDIEEKVSDKILSNI